MRPPCRAARSRFSAQQSYQDLIVGQVVRPVVGREHRRVETAVRLSELGRSGIVEIGESAILHLGLAQPLLVQLCVTQFHQAIRCGSDGLDHEGRPVARG